MTITTKATPVAGSNDIKYTATCKVDASTTTTTTTTITVSPIDVRWVNVGQSKTALRPSGQGFATQTGQLSTQRRGHRLSIAQSQTVR